MLADTTIGHAHVDQVWADSLRALPEYTYATTGPSLMDQLWRWFFDVLREIGDGRADSITDFLGYLVIAGVILALVMIFRRSGSAPVQIDRRGHVQAADEALEAPENIDRLIGTAVSEQRYRDAVRLLYLRTLADLRDSGRIVWHAEKTDSDYVRELRSSWEHADDFAAAVRHFQWTWYGERAVDEAAFSAVRSVFDDLRTRL